MNYLLLSTLTSLLDNVVQQLRAVTVNFKKSENKIILHFFYDGEINDKFFELASCASAEINLGPDFHSHFSMNDDIAIQLDYPKEIPIDGRLVYLRKEPGAEKYIKEKRSFDEIKFPLSRLILLLQQALLGKVNQNLRSVSTTIDARKFYLYFIYDGEITEENSSLTQKIISEVSSFYPEYSIETEISRLDFPQKITNKGERVAFSRNEDH